VPESTASPTVVMAGAEPFSFAGGEGPDGRTGVLLVHGFTGNPSSMRAWGEHLAAEGFAVRGPRLPGHGTAWQDCNTTTAQDWLDEVHRAFDELAAECDAVVVGGLSMGGTLAIRFAEQRPGDLAGLVLVNPSLLTERFDAKLLPLLARLTPSWAPIGSDIKKPGVTELAYPKLPTRAMMSLRRLWTVTRADLSRITAPVLVFRSTEDHVVEPASAAALQAGISSTDVSEVLLEDSYHVATLDNDAEKIFTESAAWIRAHAVAAPSRGLDAAPTADPS
jgi:esterase/lipase